MRLLRFVKGRRIGKQRSVSCECRQREPLAGAGALEGSRAIVHWNTVYLDRTVSRPKQAGKNISDTPLNHISPLSWEHINLTGIHIWDTEHQMPEGFWLLGLHARRLRAAKCSYFVRSCVPWKADLVPILRTESDIDN
jgi:hypothetical protein